MGISMTVIKNYGHPVGNLHITQWRGLQITVWPALIWDIKILSLSFFESSELVESHPGIAMRLHPLSLRELYSI
jgi:hypothetical protein